MLPPTFLIHYSSMPKYPSKSHYVFQKKSSDLMNRFEEMAVWLRGSLTGGLTADGSYSMWNSLSKLEKEWNLQGWPTKTPHSLGVFYFGLGSVSRGVTHFYGSSFAMKLEFSSISKTNLTLAEFLKKYFINHHASFSGTDHW